METAKVDPQSIIIHSAQAGYYKYRTPYLPKFFRELGGALGLSQTTCVADFACGRGELSLQLADYAGKVYGVDGSEEMIALAAKKSNIDYIVCDLNSDTPAIPRKVDHFFFGRSIHWFPKETLMRLSGALLHERGKIVVCSTQWEPVGAWGQAYYEVKEKYVPKANKNNRRDFSGRSVLADAGFSPVSNLTVSADIRVATDFMVGHTFATSYREKLAALESHAPAFRAELTARLRPFEANGDIVLRITSWAIIYQEAAANR